MIGVGIGVLAALLLLGGNKSASASYPRSTARRVLDVARHEVEIGIREEPPGSNWSTSPEGGIAKYGGAGPAKWCVRFVKWVLRQARAGGVADLGDTGSVASTVRNAQETGRWHPVEGPWRPRPGDLYVLRGRTHLGIVEEPGTGEFRSIDGNSSDRVARRTRRVQDVEGWIDPY